MDGNLPEKRGLDLVHQVRQRLEQTKVLVLLSATDEAQAAEYIVAGAHGLVMKDSSLGGTAGGHRASPRWARRSAPRT